MPERPSYRPVCKALHRPLTIWGVDRRLFFLCLLLGAATFNLFYSFLAGLLIAGGLYAFALWATARDPEMLRILLGSSRTRRRYDPAKHVVFSNASCTTNCLAPVAKVLDEKFGIVKGNMLTVHSYTNDQNILDLPHKDLRRARAAAVSMIPSSTGAAKAIGLVLPSLKGKLDGTSIRVPTPNVSVVDFKFTTAKPTTKEAVNEAIKAAAASGPLKGILGTNSEPLVSMDFNHNPASSTFDLGQTQVIEGVFVRVLSWYDNEWGFSNRMGDVAVEMGKLG